MQVRRGGGSPGGFAGHLGPQPHGQFLLFHVVIFCCFCWYSSTCVAFHLKVTLSTLRRLCVLPCYGTAFTLPRSVRHGTAAVASARHLSYKPFKRSTFFRSAVYFSTHRISWICLSLWGRTTCFDWSKDNPLFTYAFYVFPRPQNSTMLAAMGAPSAEESGGVADSAVSDGRTIYLQLFPKCYQNVPDLLKVLRSRFFDSVPTTFPNRALPHGRRCAAWRRSGSSSCCWRRARGATSTATR